MEDWNVIATVGDSTEFRAARRHLRAFGAVEPTVFHNVLVLRVPDIDEFLDVLEARLAHDKSLLNHVARILPAQICFDFTTAEEFTSKARQIVLDWAPLMVGSCFHARFNRRGHRSDLPSLPIERLLDETVLAKTAELGSRARVEFHDPDYVIDVETVGDRAGLSLWSRVELQKFPFLRID